MYKAGDVAITASPGAFVRLVVFRHLAYINVQHPDSGVDRTFKLLAPTVNLGEGKYD
jgi:hypothetical protein